MQLMQISGRHAYIGTSTMCFFCRPTCEECHPKRVVCPKCGKNAFLVMESCPQCGYEFTSDDRAKSIARWKESHPDKADSMNRQ